MLIRRALLPDETWAISSIMQPIGYHGAVSARANRMKYKSFDHMNCSLAQTLEVIGERWTLLILRDAFFGVKRFGQFQSSLGIARNILTSRLNRLIEEGVLEKRSSEEGAHFEYVLTEKGLDLQPVLLSMTHWGDKHKRDPRGDRVVFIERATGKPIRRMSVIGQDGRVLHARDIKARPGPALDSL
jgi:DNA-binding HxlR family transcriptional regulator|tara:strand:- start:236 stop:793 length:558 start_codon:yes stop_codon:yes gene_type:complete